MNDMESERQFGWGAVGLIILALLLIFGAIYFAFVYFGGNEEAAELPPVPTMDVTQVIPTAAADATGTGASLALSPPAGAAGEAITATGAGFPPDSTIVFLMGPAVEGAATQEIGRTTADAAGAFVFALGLPDVWPGDETPIPDGAYTIVAATEDGSAQAAANLEYSADAEPDGTGEPLPSSEAGTGDVLVYTNELYGVSFSYPATWTGVPGDPNRYEGPDGFFVIDAAGGADADLTVVCESQNNPDLLPYGTAPTITYITVAGQPACLITPSADQPAEMNGQAALIITYPAPITLDDGAIYYHFVLYADQAHIMDPLATTLAFLAE